MTCFYFVPPFSIQRFLRKTAFENIKMTETQGKQEEPKRKRAQSWRVSAA